MIPEADINQNISVEGAVFHHRMTINSVGTRY